MNLFEGRLDIQDAYMISNNLYKIIGNYVDNSGSFTSRNVSIGDIIYINGAMLGYTLLRYKIKNIIYDEMVDSLISVEASWDMVEGMEIVEPCGGLDGIVGALHFNGLTANITSESANNANGVLVSRAASYQTMLLSTISGGDTAPDLSIIKKDIVDLKEKVSSIKIEWEDLLI